MAADDVEADGGPPLVRAAGGVVWRRAGPDDGSLEVALVHRPRYDDWSLPKGKHEPGETDEQTAVREIEEETGLTCRLGPELPTVRYTDARGRPKVVRYWAMTVVRAVDRSPDDEVDAWRWVLDGHAPQLLSYRRDREVLQALRSVVDDR
jgi:8-oxo-dGTP diphosphatase